MRCQISPSDALQDNLAHQRKRTSKAAATGPATLLTVVSGLPATRTYQSKDIVVYWYPELCVHVRHCAKILPEVFKPEGRPWVNVDAASAREIILAIDRCPSGALRYSLPEGSTVHEAAADGPGRQREGEETQGQGDTGASCESAVVITTLADGPLMTEGLVRLLGPEGEVLAESSRLTLCRCGLSRNKPFCDGEHVKAGWRADDTGHQGY